jgi:cytochrome P450
LVRQGELVMGVIPFAQRDEATFPNPDTFDPDRFDDRFASSHLIWPRGLHDAVVTATDRTCPGKDVALIIAKLFSVNLLRKASWQLAEKPQWDQRHFSLNVAAPKGPLMVEGFRYRN